MAEQGKIHPVVNSIDEREKLIPKHEIEALFKDGRRRKPKSVSQLPPKE